MTLFVRLLTSIAREGSKAILYPVTALAVMAAPAIAASSLAKESLTVREAQHAAALDSLDEGETGKVVAASASKAGDPEFNALFQSWKKLDALSQGAISIPSTKPVESATFTSDFGVRADPFRRVAAMHAGIDLAGPVGTPVYATADGVIDRAEWAGGYGNLVEIDHGKGVQTRFGHLSRILVKPNTFVKRGELIALMGSTGRSTGSHLHYEVRIDGRAVNPLPYLQSADYVSAVKTRVAAANAKVALGGPDEVD
ncbi:M23 family metallopeptidase [Sphingomonas naphthae]|uniref:M23 family metallopeptidase n=1 Tax=Sphingomonas naphthae TaxID=1813468 RepID=A0ABY7TK89_9SPHN|nr:M23 family metallopeptidase [Sphingomonas naphthae]WCT73371.1 M23 family metallopeptidase [Sphingomonas naphthae]